MVSLWDLQVTGQKWLVCFISACWILRVIRQRMMDLYIKSLPIGVITCPPDCWRTALEAIHIPSSTPKSVTSLLLLGQLGLYVCMYMSLKRNVCACVCVCVCILAHACWRGCESVRA
jgi:hypothetical protein